MNQLRAEQEGFDLFMTDVMWTGSFMEPELVEPIDDYMEDGNLMIDEYDYDDHLDVYAETLGTWKGTRYGLPFWGDALRMAVRKDLLEEHADEYRDKYGSDILPPFPEGYESYEEYNQVAEFMSEKGYPIGLEAKRGQGIPYHYACRYAAATGDETMLSEDNKSELDRSGAEAALDHYLTQVQWAKNPTSTGFTESMNQFINGDTWAHETWTFSVSQALSKYGWEDQMRVVMTPGGYPCLGGFGFLINSFVDQQKKDAAFVAAQHLTSKEVDKALFKMGLGATRASSHTDSIKQEVPQARYTDPEENPGIKTMSIRPNVPQYSELSDAMSVQFSDAFANPSQANAGQVIQSVHEKWNDVLSSS
jgi:ABC-type glycerol-3-phosphate transport system substrate-binding protein